MVTGAVCGGLLVAGIVWIVVTGLLARAKLHEAEGDLSKLRAALLSGQVDRATTLVGKIGSEAAEAHSLTSGPAWWVGANLPFVGTPLQTARVIATASHRIGDGVLPGVVSLADTVSGSSLMHGPAVDLQPLVAARPLVARAEETASSAIDDLEATHSSSWLSLVDHNRDALAARLVTLQADLAGAERALDAAVPMLGENGPRRYFVGFMNEAESRGLGGIPGAFAIVTVDHGQIRFTHFGSDSELDGVRAHVNLGKDYSALYGSADPTGVFVNSDISPDFRDAARIWAGMWQTKTGQRIDGAIAIDPTALSYLLRVTGPAHLSGATEVSADDVVALTQQRQYALFPHDKQARKRFTEAVSQAVADRLISGAASSTDLLKAAGRAVSERRLMLWSSHPMEEKSLVAADYAGALLAPPGTAFTGFTTVNATGGKLDYYLSRTMTYRRTECGTHTTAVASVTLTNNAPRTGLPAYVTIRADRHSYRTRPGDNRLILTYYGTRGARLTSATVDGKAVQVSAGSEHGLVTVSLDLELPVGQSRTFTLRMTEPRTSRSTRVLSQPAVQPSETRSSVSACARS